MKKIKEYLFEIILFLTLVIIFAVLFWLNAPYKSEAAQSYSTTSYASTTYNIATGNVSVFAWVNKNSDTNLDFAWAQKTTLDNQNMNLVQRSAAGGNDYACQGLTGSIDQTVKPNYGKWEFVACVFDGINMTGYIFNLDGTLRASVAGAATRTGTEDGFVIGSAATNNWNGSVRMLTVSDAVLTQAQLRRAMFCNGNPYNCGIPQIELFCPLTSGTDNRCWTGSGQISLKMFSSPSTSNDPPTTPFTF